MDEKVFGVCENKCFVEVPTKEQLEHIPIYSGESLSINDISVSGTLRLQILQDSDDANYLGWYGMALVETFTPNPEWFSMQRITRMTTGEIYTRANQGTPFTYDNVLSKSSLSNHNHDSRYYTETEVNEKLAGKSDTSHNHDSRYYTETEIDTKLANYKLKGDFAIIEKSMTLTANTSEKATENECTFTETTINYPSGFTAENCIVLNQSSISNNNFTYGWVSKMTSAELALGFFPTTVSLYNTNTSSYTNKIRIRVGNLSTSSKTIICRIVLMKV